MKRPNLKDYYTGNQLTHFEYMNRYRDDMEKYVDHLENKLAEINNLDHYSIEQMQGKTMFVKNMYSENYFVNGNKLSKIVNGK